MCEFICIGGVISMARTLCLKLYTHAYIEYHFNKLRVENAQFNLSISI